MVNIKALMISLNILFAQQISIIMWQVYGADWAAMPMHERRHLLEGKEAFQQSEWTDRAGLRIQMPGRSAHSVADKEAGGEKLGGAWASQSGDQSTIFPLMQVSIRPCHLATNTDKVHLSHVLIRT